MTDTTPKPWHSMTPEEKAREAEPQAEELIKQYVRACAACDYGLGGTPQAREEVDRLANLIAEKWEGGYQ